MIVRRFNDLEIRSASLTLDYNNPSVTAGMGLSPLSVTIRPVSSVTRGASEIEGKKTHP